MKFKIFSLLTVVVVVLFLAVAFVHSAITPSSVYKPQSYSCSEPLRNTTALIYRPGTVNSTLHTLTNYRNELLNVERVDLEPINILPKLCRNAITNLTKLRVLSLVLTSIEDIEPGAFANLALLDELNLNYNHLQQLKEGVFANLPVSKLYLAGNRIYNIHPQAFDNLAQLRSLDLSFNQVQFIDPLWFKQSPKASSLNFMFNLLSQLDAQAFPHLNGTLSKVDLSFMNNSIAKVHRDAFKGIQHMGTLSLAGNKLRFLDDQLFNGIRSIDALFMQENEMLCLSEKMLGGTRIREIHLKGNPIVCNCMAKLEQWSIASNTKTFNAAKDLQRCGVKSKFIELTTKAPEGVLVEL